MGCALGPEADGMHKAVLFEARHGAIVICMSEIVLRT